MTRLRPESCSNDRREASAATRVKRGESLNLVQRFARIFGASYLLVGPTGFVPSLLLRSLQPGVVASRLPENERAAAPRA